ncbi:MAG: GHKL domain-containing protein [Firmicutes bacterium]|nr:GHKL domain-containing protein [Bacillota bacterium]
MQKNGRVLIISTMLLEALFIVLINQEIYHSQAVDDLKAVLPFVNLIILIFSGLTVFSIKGLEENAKKEMELNLLKAHILQVEDLMNTLQTRQHDHSRHIQTIQSMLYLDEKDKATEYIEGIAERYRHTEKIVHVGHPALTALLNSKQIVAEAKNIQFAFAVKCDIVNIDVSPWDLCSILGNLLDNALEATLQDQIDRRVAVEIKYEDTNYVLYVYNTGPKITARAMRQLYTPGYTTKNSAACGYGLYLVKKIVDKYGGKIDVISRERTTFIVYLPDRGKVKDVQSTCAKNCYNHGSTITG